MKFSFDIKKENIAIENSLNNRKTCLGMTETPSSNSANMNSGHTSTSLFSLSNIATEPPMLTAEEEETEKKHLEKIVSALRLYR